jgi:hypothetical protein
MSQANSEMNFLNKAKWLDFYGVDLQTVLVRRESKVLLFYGLILSLLSFFVDESKILN